MWDMPVYFRPQDILTPRFAAHCDPACRSEQQASSQPISPQDYTGNTRSGFLPYLLEILGTLHALKHRGSHSVVVLLQIWHDDRIRRTI